MNKQKPFQRSMALIVAVCLFFSQTAAHALPQGYAVESGQVTFDTSDPNTLTITASDQAIINFDSFSIGANEAVRFVQADSANSVLGRVTGGGASDIYGSLFGNSSLFLVNPNGINFYAGSNVQVHNLIASTLDVQSAMFQARQYTFEKQAGSGVGRIFNEGTVTGSNIALMAEDIENRGHIQANLGSIVLGIGERQTLSFDPSGRINLVIDQGLADSLNKSIRNSGTLQADGGVVFLSARSLNQAMDTIINNTGVIQAQKTAEKFGRVVFDTDRGVRTLGVIRASDIEITPGTLVRGGTTQFTIERDWLNEGFFDGEDSQVQFVGPSVSRISGDNEFHDFKVAVPSKELRFDTSQAQTIDGDLVIEGAYGQHVKLLSMSDGTQWSINPTGNIDISYAWVQDSINLNGVDIVMRESTNRGNSVLWDPIGTWTNGSADGLWSTAANWSGLGGATPGAGDDVVFDGTSNTASSVDALFGGTIGSLSLNGGYTETVTLARSLTTTIASGRSGDVSISSGTLDLADQTLTIGGDYVNSATLDASTGTVTFGSSGLQTLTAGSSSFYNLTHTGTGTLRVLVAPVTVTNNFTNSSGTFNADGKNMVFGGNFTNSGTFMSGTGTMTFNSAGTQTLSAGSSTLNNVVHSGSGTLQLAANLTTASFTNSGGTFDLAGRNWTNTGVFSNDATVRLRGSETVSVTQDIDSGAWRYAGDGDAAADTFTIRDFGATDYFNLIIDGVDAADVFQLGDSLTVAGGLTTSAGTFSLNGQSWTMTGATFSNNATVRLRGTETITGLIQDIDSGTWSYVGDGDAAADTFTIRDFGATDYFNLTIASTDAADVFESAASKTIANNLTLTSGTFSLDGNDLVMTGTSFSNNATFQLQGGETITGMTQDTDSGIWRYVGDGDLAADNFTIRDFGATDYFSLVIASSDAADDYQLAAALGVAGNLIVSSGSFTDAVNTITFNGAGTQTFTTNGETFDSIVHSGAGTLQLSGDPLTVLTAFTNSAGTFSLNGENWTMTGATFSNDGTIQLQGGETITGLTPDTDSGTWSYVGDGDAAADTFTVLDFGATDYFNLTIASTDAADVFEFASAKTVTNALTISSGVLSLDGQDLTATGATFENSGTFQLQGTETITGLTQDTDSGIWRYVGDGDALADTFTILDFGGTDYFNLTIAGTDAADVFQLGAAKAIDGALTVSGGTYDTNGLATAIAGGLTVNGGTFAGSAGAVDVNGAVTLSSGTLTAPSGNFTVAGDWTQTGGVFTPGTNTVEFDGASDQSLNSGGTSFYNILHSGGATLQLTGNALTVLNDLDNSMGTFSLNGQDWTMTGATFSNDGTIQMQGGETITGLVPDTDSGDWRYVGDGDSVADTFTIQDFVATDYFNLIIISTDADDVFQFGVGAAPDIGNSLAITSGILDLNGQNWDMTGASFSNNGTVQLQGIETITGLTQDTDSGTWRYVGNGDSIADIFTIRDFGATDYFNLTIASTDAIDTYQLAGALGVSGNFTVTSGIFDPSGNTAVFDGAGTQTLDPGGINFFNITHSGTGTLQLLGDLTVTNNFTNSAGTFDLNGQDWTMTGAAFSNDGIVQLRGSETVTDLTQDTNSGTWRYVGDGDSAADTFTIIDFGATDYFNLILAPTDASEIFQFATDKTIANALTISSGTMDLNGQDWTMTGATFSHNGTVQLQGGETVTGLTQDTNSGIWRYVGDADSAADTFTLLDFGAIDYHRLVIAPTDSADVFQLAAANRVGNNLTLSSGVFDLNGQNWTMTGASFSNDSTVQLVGSETITGLTPDTNSGTFLFVGDNDAAADSFTISNFAAANDYFNLVITSADAADSYQLAGSIGVAGNFIINSGSFTPSGSGVTFSGSGTQTLATDGQSFHSITHSGSGTLQLSGDALTVTNSFANSAGTFDLNGQNWTMTGASFTNNGTVRLRGSETVTGLVNDTDSGTWRYVGDGDSAADTFVIQDFGATDYFNLILAPTDSADTFQLAGANTVAGAYTQSSGSYNANTFATTVTGAAAISGGGSYTASTGTQTFGGLSLSGVTFTASTGDIDVNGDFSMTSGIFTAPGAGADFTVSEDFLVTGGTFNHNNGTVTLDTTAFATLNAPLAGLEFAGLSINTPGKTVGFTAGDTFEIGTWSVNGSDSDKIVLRSTLAGTRWNVFAQAFGITHVNVSDSIVTAGPAINPLFSIDGGNTVNWFVSGGGGGGPEGCAELGNCPDAGGGGQTPDFNALDEGRTAATAGLKEPPKKPKKEFQFDELFDLDSVDEATTSSVEVDEGAVYIVGIDGEENMLYDGEKISVSKKGTDILKRGIYISSLDGLLALRGKTFETLKEFEWRERPTALAASRDGRHVYAASFEREALVDIRTATFEVGRMKGVTGGEASYIVLNRRGDIAYLLNSRNDSSGGDRVRVYDMKAKKITHQFLVGAMPTQAVLSPDETVLYVVERLDGTVSSYDLTTFKKIRSTPVGESPYGLCVSADSQSLYVTDTLKDNIIVLDAKTLLVVGKVAVGRGPYAIDVNPKDPYQLFTANRSGKSVSIVDLRTYTQTGAVKVGRRPADMVVLPEGDKLIVVNELSDNLSVVDIKSRRTIQEVSTGFAPNRVVLSTPEKSAK